MFHWLGSLFGTVLGVISLVVAVGGALFAFSAARQFVRNRLRFVDGVDNPVLPWVVGIVGVIGLSLVFALLPLVGTGSALLIGSSAGFGTASGVKALKRGD